MKVAVEMDSSRVGGAFGFHVEIKAIGIDEGSEEEALDLTKRTMEWIAKGRRTLVRIWPEADTYREFDTKRIYYKGYARFTVLEAAGEWENSEHVVTKVTS